MAFISLFSYPGGFFSPSGVVLRRPHKTNVSILAFDLPEKYAQNIWVACKNKTSCGFLLQTTWPPKRPLKQLRTSWHSILITENRNKAFLPSVTGLQPWWMHLRLLSQHHWHDRVNVKTILVAFHQLQSKDIYFSHDILSHGWLQQHQDSPC